MKFEGRKVIFKTLIGSHNYNLNDENSDKDYKVFVAPTFDDLYCNNTFSKLIIDKDVDLDIHDIRKLNNLWWKANVNYLEVLYSDEMSIYDFDNIADIIKIRNDIVTMNLPYLYDACLGMHHQKKKLIKKGTSGTQHLVDKYGYDTKQAMHSIRILDFLIRFANNDFTDFKGAIWYANEDPKRELLLGLKNGKFKEEEYYNLVEEYLNEIEGVYKNIYKSKEQNKDINVKLQKILKNTVKKYI